MRVLLLGNPNVGKSAIFSRLTGSHVVVSNYAGTTVEYTRGALRTEDAELEVIDVPGTYALEPTNRAEAVASEMIADGDMVVNVMDATNLERSLYLTLQLLLTGKPVVVALNMWDEAQMAGIAIDTGMLEERLGVQVIATCALTGEGIPLLKSRLPDARSSSLVSENGVSLWQKAAEISEEVQQKPGRRTTFRDKLDHATVHPVYGPLLALFVLLLSFGFVAYFGDFLYGILADIFEIAWLPVALWMSALLGGGGIIHDILIGGLIEGEIRFEESFGLMTTGLFIPLAVVLPYIFSFYLVLSLLEDVGYLPRLGVVVDAFMQRLGIHGLSIVPLMLGIGCNVPGVMAGRMLETRKERFIVATLIAIVVPCMAQQAMVIGLLGQAGVAGLAIVYGTLFLLWIVTGLIMNLFIKGESPELLIDLPAYRKPYWESLWKKIYMRMNGFIRSALPYVLLGVFIVNLFYTLGAIDYISRAFAPVITGLFGLPGEAGGALIIGFLRKDVAVGMLAPLGLELNQLIVASVVLMVYFPCIATFVVLFKEIGLRDLLKLTAIMIFVVAATGGGLHLLLQHTGF
jgi:ferrous iron transport protein B